MVGRIDQDVRYLPTGTWIQSLRPDYEPPPELEIAFDARSRAAVREDFEQVALATDPGEP